MPRKTYYRKTGARVVSLLLPIGLAALSGGKSKEGAAEGSEINALTPTKEYSSVKDGISSQTTDADIEWEDLDDEEGETEGGPNRAAIDNPRPSIFFRLPRELRDAVYAETFELLDLPSTITLIDSTVQIAAQWQIAGIVPQFCFPNRQIYTESLPILIESRTIMFGSLGAFRKIPRFLKTKEGFQAIRQLSFPGMVYWVWPQGMDPRAQMHRDRCARSNVFPGEIFAWRCTNLQHLTIHMDNSQFTRSESRGMDTDGREDRAIVLRDIDIILRDLAPFILFKLPKLRTAKLVCVGASVYVNYAGMNQLVSTEHIFEKIRDWIKEEMAKREVSWELKWEYRNR